MSARIAAPDLGVGLDDRTLLGRERLRFAKQRLGDRHLADVMEAGAEADDAACAFVEPKVPGDRVGHADETRRVLLGLVVLGLERVGEHHRETLEHGCEKAQAQRLVGKLAALERALQHGEQVHRLERLGDERDRAGLHRLHGEVEVAKCRDHDARDHRVHALRVSDEVDAVGVRHRVVGDHRIEAALGCRWC